MPGGDGNGPWSRGPMTGKGRGYCSEQNPTWGRGRGFGRGMGGFGNGGNQRVPIQSDLPLVQPQDLSPENEKVYLENIVKEMEIELIEIKKRLKELSQK